MKNVEIEIQVSIEKSEPLLAFLKKNAEFKSEKRQIDEYFSPAHRDFIAVRPAAEWLRLRESDGHYSFCYKYWHHEGEESLYCDEYETGIEEPEKMRKILKALDFKSLVTVDKSRQVWRYLDFEIALDSVKNLGEFVEIEYKGKDENADPKTITEEMVKFLKAAGCGEIKINFQGYPYLLLFPQEAKYETL
jgi:adenylate cyclase class 2